MLKKILSRIYPDAGKKYALLRAFWKHKSLKPQKVLLPVLNNALYLNWDEPRGRAVILCDALGQPDIKKFWIEAVQSFKPDVVIDCGVNYGEIIYYCAYPKTAQIIGIEADKALMPFITQSKEDHPNKDQITLYNAFVSDKSDAEISFFVDKKWSGRSSAFVTDRMKEGEVEERKLQTLSIDSLVGSQAAGKRVLFKIDVEGYEPYVLRGMAATVAACKDALGIIEFNTSFFSKSGLDVSHFLTEINSVFDISLIEKLEDDVDIMTYLSQKNVNTDLILSKKKIK
jgi:FkbM family methyltransferase